ncbi:MAG: tripartite tricarboxylate transporter substrate binding protein [Stomatobaculum sp.]|nr:tripartite tricarboxylate transporter substrate binding protein [Stomatobaculum sp.]
MKIRKIAAMFLAAAMTASLAACGGSSKPAETTAAPAAAETTAAAAAAETKAAAANTEGLPEKPADFPTSTITCYVGYSAGGGVDTAARLLLKYAQNYIDVPLVVQNVTGAGGSVAVTQALGAPADGTTLISFAVGAMTSDITGAASYDFRKDLSFVSLQDQVPYALVFRANDSRFSDVDTFLQYVKDHPGELTVSTSGVNNANYFATMSFFEENGMQVELVPFDGSADAKTGFLGEHVDLYCETLLETNQMVRDGSAKYVCTFGDVPYVDGVPTSKDLGMTMSITSTIRGYAYKAGTPQDVVDYISAVFELCEKDPGFIEECAALGLDKCIDYKNPADTTAFIEEQYESYKKYCEAQGIAK